MAIDGRRAFHLVLQGYSLTEFYGGFVRENQRLWRRLDTPGLEAVRLIDNGSSGKLIGSAIFVHETELCQLQYHVDCDSGWRTRSAEVEGWVGDRRIAVSLSIDEAGIWTINDEICAAVQGCDDVDLNFSPSTNLLPIRRLQLAIGESAAIRAAWLRFPGFRLEPLEQVYRRTAVDRYRYESGGGRFVADLKMGPEGLVVDYPPIWQAELSQE